MLKLELRALREQLEDLWQLSRKERRTLPGLDPQKADVILTGAVIYEMAMVHLGFEKMLISSRGVRYGALLNQVKAPLCSP
jgi:exopolyphosphatase/guanosine-5'-triphosphate,3'-diphosphate pyrophosphatase